MPCSKCGKTSGRYPTTMRQQNNVARVGGTAPVRYMVNGRRFSTRTAAEDYASQHPGSVIRTL